MFDTPADAKNIDERELKYIRVGEAAYQCGANCKNGSKVPLSLITRNSNLFLLKLTCSFFVQAVPWRKILGSLVVWSTALSSFSQNFMNVGTVIYLPTYYQNVLGMDLSSVSFFAFLLLFSSTNV